PAPPDPALRRALEERAQREGPGAFLNVFYEKNFLIWAFLFIFVILFFSNVYYLFVMQLANDNH
ncbi:MAG: hypothetical protein JTT16_00045, partial [Candidatus Brockarchaeota archaeon]|nr:hypothetical protein [Candidatus Brockarchaeota archaeon]